MQRRQWKHLIRCAALAAAPLLSPSRSAGAPPAAGPGDRSTPTAPQPRASTGPEVVAGEPLARRRARVLAESHRLYNAGDLAGAIRAGEEAFDCDRQLLNRRYDEEAANLMRYLAELNLENEDFVTARKAWEFVVHIETDLRGENHVAVADARRSSAEVDELATVATAAGRRELIAICRAEPLIDRLQNQNKLEDALALAAKAVATRSKLLGRDSTALARSLQKDGLLHAKLRDYDEAEREFRRATEMRRRLLGPQDSLSVESVLSLANLLESEADMLVDLTDYDAAINKRREALEIRRTISGTSAWQLGDFSFRLDQIARIKAMTPATRSQLRLADDRLDRAQQLASQNRLREAADTAAEARKTYGQLASSGDPRQWTSTLAEAGYRARFDAPAAETLFQEALRLQREAEGEDHPDYRRALADDLSRRAGVARWDGRFDDAVRWLTAAIVQYDAVDGPENGRSDAAAEEIAFCRHASQLSPELRLVLREAEQNDRDARDDETARAFDKALVGRRKALSLRVRILNECRAAGATPADLASDEIRVASAKEQLAALLVNGPEPDTDRAVALYREAVATRERIEGPNHPGASSCRQQLADALAARAEERERKGEFGTALQDATDAMALRSPALPPWDVKIVYLRLAIDYMGRIQELPSALQEKARAAEIAAGRASELHENSKWAQATRAWAEAMRLHREAVGENDYRYAWLLCQSAAEPGNDPAADAEALRRATEFYRSQFGPDNPEYVNTAEKERTRLLGMQAVAQFADDAAGEARIDERLLALSTDLYGSESGRTKYDREAFEGAKRRAHFGAADQALMDESRRLDRALLKWTAGGSSAAKVVELTSRRIEIRRTLFGGGLAVADALVDRADSLRAANQPQAAARDEAEALGMRTAVLGPRHTGVVWARLRGLYRERTEAHDRHDVAAERRALHDVLALRLWSVGRNDWRFIADRYAMEYMDVVATLGDAGKAALAEADRNAVEASGLSKSGRFPEAIRAAEQVVAARAKYIGADSIAYADALADLGEVCWNAGDSGRAEPALREAARLYYTWFGRMNPRYAWVHKRLGIIYWAWGDPGRAGSELTESLVAMTDFLFGRAPDDPEMASFNDTLQANFRDAFKILVAFLKQKKGEAVAEGATQLLRVLQEVVTGPADSPDARELLALRGRLEGLNGDLVQAEKTLLTCRDLARAEPPSPQRDEERIASEVNLGWLYQLKHDPAAARTSYQAALDLVETRQPSSGVEAADLLRDLAAVARSQGHVDESVALALRAMPLEQGTLDRSLSTLAESEMSASLAATFDHLQDLVQLVAGRKAASGPEVDATLTWILKRKTAALAAVARRREAVSLEMNDPTVAEKARRLRFLRERIKGLKSAPPRDYSPEFLYQVTGVLRDEADHLESELSARVADVRPAGPSEFGLDQVRAHLGSAGALVEFFRGRATEAPDGAAAGPAHYFAFVLHKEAKRAVRMIDLGDAEVIDRAIDRARTAVQTFNPAVDDEAAKEAEYRPVAAELYGLIFRPELIAALGGAKDLYVAPDGKLNEIPFEAFVAGPTAKTYLVEDGYRFAYLTSGQELLRPKGEPGKGTVVFAGPDFGESAEERVSVAASLRGARAGEPQVRGVHPSTRGGRRFAALDATAREADEVLAAMASGPFSPVRRLYQGKEALRQAFLSLHGPRLLHVATHGFFDPDPGPAADGTDRTAGVVALNPLLRSGLAFAGANAGAQNSEDGDDGLVTAEEICLMDLRGTELVVLSACDSGLGELLAGQGVYGLRWAFLTAGARSLVTSLFHVPDVETQQLMGSFYGSLKAGNGKSVALHDAELAAIRARRKQGGAAHPFYWSSFVLVGEMD